MNSRKSRRGLRWSERERADGRGGGATRRGHDPLPAAGVARCRLRRRPAVPARRPRPAHGAARARPGGRRRCARSGATTRAPRRPSATARRSCAGCDRVRAAIDAFAPDALVVVGDDQYENFREDVIPPFTVLAYGDRVAVPWDPAQSVRGADRQRVGRAAGHGFPRAREARHRPRAGRVAPRRRARRRLRVRAAAPRRAAPRVHEHRALPRLPPDRVRPPDRPAGDQLLRPASDQPPRDR